MDSSVVVVGVALFAIPMLLFIPTGCVDKIYVVGVRGCPLEEANGKWETKSNRLYGFSISDQGRTASLYDVRRLGADEWYEKIVIPFNENTVISQSLVPRHQPKQKPIEIWMEENDERVSQEL